MKEMLNELAANLSDCGARNSQLYKKFGLQVGAGPPIGALGIVYNNLTVSLELVSHYFETWSRIDWSKHDQIDRRREENKQRLMLAGKSLFINTLSACEWQAKEANKKYPVVLEFPKKRPYLREILECSKERGLISERVEALWIGATKIRNCLVHNNGFADEDVTWDFGEDLKIVFEDGKEAQGTMMTMPRLTKWVYSAYVDWCDAFLTRTK